MRFVIVLACALLALASTAPVHAHHCNGTVIAVIVGSEALYVDDRSDQAGEINHWLYLESNGVEGLQSGDDNQIIEDTGPPLGYVPTLTDPCAHVDPDTIVL